MKSLFSFLAIILTISFFTSCKNTPKGDKVEAKDAKEVVDNTANTTQFNVNTQASQIIWTGSKLTGQHTGTIKLSDGKLAVNGDNVVGGEFTIDFNSLVCTDLKAGEGKEDLEAHLKDSDFFEVAKFPTGKFVITSVTPVSGDAEVTHNVTGNLTMKGITKSVTIPTNVAVMGEKVSAQSKAFNIDRTEWGIKYNSGALAPAKDKIINDQVGLVVTLVANK